MKGLFPTLVPSALQTHQFVSWVLCGKMCLASRERKPQTVVWAVRHHFCECK